MLNYFLKRVFIAFGIVLVIISSIIFFLGESSAPVLTDSQPVAIAPDSIAITSHIWTEEEKKVIESLWLAKLPPLRPDPSNAYADNEAAARLGHKLFFDTRLSANGEVSCATCHQPELNFTDGLPRSKGIGVTDRASMTVSGTAYSDWFFWDGRADSMWAQALGPPENPLEHGGNRSQFAHLIHNDPHYKQDYEAVFGMLPDLSDLELFPQSAGPLEDPQISTAWENMSEQDRDIINRIYANMGKAIAAYERLIMPGPSRFDHYVEAIIEDSQISMTDTYSEAEANGLRLFIGKAKCIDCHNGPLFTNHAFHNTGVPPAPDLPPDLGRIEGIKLAKADPFNCVGGYSDANARDCVHLRFAKTEGQDIVAAFKTPSLRNVEKVAPYMHAGQIPTLAEVVKHYNQAPASAHGVTELTPLQLSTTELSNLEAFLKSLTAPLATPTEFLAAPGVEKIGPE
jgi:cytochrome c peroxidase